METIWHIGKYATKQNIEKAEMRLAELKRLNWEVKEVEINSCFATFSNENKSWIWCLFRAETESVGEQEEKIRELGYIIDDMHSLRMSL